MGAARAIALVTVGLAACVKLLGQLCLAGQDPDPAAATAAALVALIVAAAGLALAAGLAAFRLGREEACRRRAHGTALPWRALVVVVIASLALRGLGFLWLRVHARAAAGLPLGHTLMWASGPLLAVLSALVLLGSLTG